jgi:DNA-binding NtrC family response regulator
MARTSQVLIITQDAPVRSEIDARLVQAGLDVTLAVGGKEGLRQLYQIHPDLIIVEFTAAPVPEWETLTRIRLFTDTPAIVILNRIDPCDLDRAAVLGNIELIPDSTPADQWMVMVKNHLSRKSRLTKKPKHPCPDESSPRFINMAEVAEVDRALAEIGESGEVRLIKVRGHLRSITRVKTEPHQPPPS